MRRRLILGLLAALGAALLLVALGFLAGRAASGGRGAAPVVTAVRRIARLATVQMEISDVLRIEEVKTILVFDVPKDATLRLRGRVLGGFDLDKGFDVTADEARRIVRIRLPAPQIISVDDRLEWFDEKSGFLNPITPDDRTRWTTWARAALAKSAKDAGLYDTAAQHARDLFSDAAAAFGWTAEVTVNGAPVPAAPAKLPGTGDHRD
ncbi:MAG TPA: DUF4230 domain-containing protein [Thermoanaerobaculia bacterium]|nr:DUF4230 domain-containing protein [Thermoanaerobaculia bacterium]